ncbi:cysteine proteinase [Panus rudis PR-1116 ss-1]|nr:cysteine proteinase [Panus rudis PR-1116 ss-1]
MSLDSDLEPGVTCSHLSTAFANDHEKSSLLRRYKRAISWHAQRVNEVGRPTKRRKFSSPTCNACGLSLSRPFVCLTCSYSGCWVGYHAQQHLSEAGHTFCVDSKSGSIFCAECDDIVYDATIADVYRSTTLAVEERFTSFQDEQKSREPFKAWKPNDKDAEALDGAAPLPCTARRGLLNLGQTCYLNVILQSFIANPLLRNYFLSDKHNHRLCSKAKDCTCCEMDKLFLEVYSGNEAAFGPTTFLSTTWRASSELSGYAQQDAHECFISALNQIHATSRASTKLACICIVHSTFGGRLQSEVKCEVCGNVATITDPILDINLELKGKAGGQNYTLVSCLRRFTQPEKLGAGEYTCDKCGKPTPASKRLSIRKLPPVLSFQFKRFEYKSGDRTTAQKVETPVRFPASINMAEFTTLVMKAQESAPEKGQKGEGVASNSKFTGPDALYEYDLFAVVCHEGQIDNGHYTCFARYQDEWYYFDDDKVTHSSLSACLQSQAYMCFYVKRHLDYKPYVTPSYVVKREAEAAREKEQEKEKEKEAAALEKEVEDALLATV